MQDFISLYLKYTEGGEAPPIYHRWCALSAIGALLGRSFYFKHGHLRVFPNLYCMLMGEPGARKSTAIKLIKKHITAAGYESISADRTSKEKFLMDLEGISEEDQEVIGGSKKKYDTTMHANLWGDSVDTQEPRELYVIADEFNEFIGVNNVDFISTLGSLWDWDDETTPYKSRLKNSKSLSIWQPTISVLGGNTVENFARAFPPELLGQGFLSRLLIIHGESNGKKVTFPKAPEDSETAGIIKYLQGIRYKVNGVAQVPETSLKMFDEIYTQWQPIDDLRFKSYSTRRFTQLLKLCCICAAAKQETVILPETVVQANTYLAAAEHCMPKAIGEFGKGKHSDTANKIMETLYKSNKALTVKELWAVVHKDLDKPTELGILLQNLEQAGKIFHVQQKGFLAKGTQIRKQLHVDFTLLTDEERKLL